MTTPAELNKPIVLGLGEILWDVFPDGPRFGGAPANFACSFAGLAGAEFCTGMVGAVGRDELGQSALGALAKHKVMTDCVLQLPQSTGTVDVLVDEGGHATYRFAEDAAWDNFECSPPLRDKAVAASAVCFGTLSQRSAKSRSAIRDFLSATREACLRVCDLNLRPPYWSEQVVQESLQFANVLKMNEDELPVVARVLELRGTEVETLHQVVERCDLYAAILTRGGNGAQIVDRDGQCCETRGIAVNVVDTVGAGDAFTATAILGMLQQLPLSTTAQWAECVAAFVCSQPGATPQIPAHLRIPAE